LLGDDMPEPPILVLDTTGACDYSPRAQKQEFETCEGEIRKFLEYAMRRIALLSQCFNREL
jgi:hypothetical protein